ncbi:MAG: S46 family peptidase, partial [Bacteroidales bacterium]|nr:S46 family peptidase [Bacteroidales bacterium]
LMKSKGLELKPGEIYNPQDVALSDAIVAIDGGSCSGSIISANGLMITNHHCAYGDIHSLSTPQKNYLEDGFWAMKMSDEIPIKGKSVTFLRGVSDVTAMVNTIIDSLDAIGPRGIFFMNKVSGEVEKRFKGSPYEKSLSSMWRGSKYYLYFYETFSDVRLVGAPPVSIGSFGGETDNWGWPQHKGDFAIYRVYTSADGSPAEYSAQNIPFAAKKYLAISSKGVKEDDFTMVLGYPGRTNRYISSFELREKFEILNPIVSGVRRAKLEVWKEYMDQSDELRLKYADKYFGISNYTDYAKWENLCVERFNVIEQIEQRELELSKWISQDKERMAKYGDLLANLNRGYEVKAEITRIREYFRESMVRGAELIGLGQRFNGLVSSLEREKKSEFTMEDEKIANFIKIAEKLFGELDVDADRALFKVMLRYFDKEVPKSYYDEAYLALLDKFGGDTDKLADYVYDNSIITNKERFDAFFSQKRDVAEIVADPVISVVKTTGIRNYNVTEDSLLKDAGVDPAKDRSSYVKAMYEMQMEWGDVIYPDANSTMRLTYGEIGGIKARDAVYYHFKTTTDGILEKIDPNNYEFRVKPELESALKRKDWGRWGESGVLYVNFMADNDITGGNSGSAVLNGKGELIGLAFDGNRESMAGDVFYVEGYCKSVNVDIRYVMWVIEKFAGAGHLIEEMEVR